MGESTEPVAQVKTEPEDNFPEGGAIANGFIGEDEELKYFTQLEVDNTRKCLENTRIIIKDFETQLDFHLEQYMVLRNMYNTVTGNNEPELPTKPDELTIADLNALIYNHPDGNKNFIKRKSTLSYGTHSREKKQKRKADGEEGSGEETDYSDEDSAEFDEDEEEEENSDDMDDPSESSFSTSKTKGRKRGGRMSITNTITSGSGDDSLLEPKEEIDEEEHELIVPKEESMSEEEIEPPVVAPAPKKRGRKPKINPAATAAAKKKTAAATKAAATKAAKAAQSSSLKKCQVMLTRIDGETVVKVEVLEKEQVDELVKPKLVSTLAEFQEEADTKPLALLSEENYKEFDFKACSKKNVIITYEDSENLPEFIYLKKEVYTNIIADNIKLVYLDVYKDYQAEHK